MIAMQVKAGVLEANGWPLESCGGWMQVFVLEHVMVLCNAELWQSMNSIRAMHLHEGTLARLARRPGIPASAGKLVRFGMGGFQSLVGFV